MSQSARLHSHTRYNIHILSSDSFVVPVWNSGSNIYHCRLLPFKIKMTSLCTIRYKIYHITHNPFTQQTHSATFASLQTPLTYFIFLLIHSFIRFYSCGFISFSFLILRINIFLFVWLCFVWLRYLPVYPAVHCYHYKSRNPEANRTRNNGIRFIRNEYAGIGVLLLPFQWFGCRIPSEEYWCKRYESGK